MCRALKVLCVAPDGDGLRALKLAAVSAEWELAPGATSEEAALTQVESERPHVLVVFGDFDGLVARVRESLPFIRIVADRNVPGATAVAGSYDDVRNLVNGLPRPGGPVR
jgi:hypothetical protein